MQGSYEESLRIFRQGARLDAHEYENSSITSLERYWFSLDRDRDIPYRSDIKISELNEEKDRIFILERISSSIARFRYAGEYFYDAFGLEIRGMPFSTFFDHRDRRIINSELQSIFETPQISQITMNVQQGASQSARTSEMLLCPLRSDDGSIDRIIGYWSLEIEDQLSVIPKFKFLNAVHKPVATPQPPRTNRARTQAKATRPQSAGSLPASRPNGPSLRLIK